MFLADKLNKGGSLGGYQISRSLRFNSADSAYLNRTPASAGNRRTWTWSGWVKRGLVDLNYRSFFSNGNAVDTIMFWNDNSLAFRNFNGSSYDLITTQVFRDPSAWYHLVIAMDTTQATSSNRIKIYVNGVQVTAFATATYPSQNYDTGFNTTTAQYLGYNEYNYFNGYMTDVNFIDGQALTPSSFGETNAQTGVWQPKAYSGSYGTNGFYLNFSDNSNTTAATLGKDYSGNGNNWTPNNFSVTAGAGNDSLVDSPTSYGVDTGVGGTVRGNYCTLNPLRNLSGTATLTNGNLDFTPTSGYPMVPATFGMTTGKWYWENTLGASGNVGRSLGIVNGSASTSTYIGDNANGWGYYTDGRKLFNATGTAYGATFTNGDTIGVAFDADSGTLVFYKNGASQGTAFNTGLTSGPYFPAVSAADAGQTGTTSMNFGQRPFAYTAPSGFQALCTQNLPTPTIGATTATQAGKFFNPVIYTGNAPSSQSITGVGFQPDFVWVKNRSNAGGYWNGLFDSVRGVNKVLVSNSTMAEDAALTQQLNSFNSDGFTVGTNSDGGNYTNLNGNAYVGWNWRASGSTVSNTAGSITSTVSASTTSGFSVVTYTGNATSGATVGHGLGVAPSMIILKIRSTSGNWPVYHVSNGNTKAQYLDLTLSAGGDFTGAWNNTTPTSTLFTLGNSTETNASGGTFVAYCFAPVAGYSAFGSYTGNGSTDGAFVFTGMRPSYVMFKSSSSATDWVVEDTTRSTTNVMDARLFPNTGDAELSNGNGNIDFVSNGFKLRNAHSAMNASGVTYIYMAFASNPFKYSLAR